MVCADFIVYWLLVFGFANILPKIRFLPSSSRSSINGKIKVSLILKILLTLLILQGNKLGSCNKRNTHYNSQQLSFEISVPLTLHEVARLASLPIRFSPFISPAFSLSFLLLLLLLLSLSFSFSKSKGGLLVF